MSNDITHSDSSQRTLTLGIPEVALVVLIGTSSSGKTTFAHQHFLPSEVLSSDKCREMVCDDENSLEASADAFEVLHFIAEKRLRRGLLTVVDATNVQEKARSALVGLARRNHVLPVAIVLDVEEEISLGRHKDRSNRNFGAHIIQKQARNLKKSLKKLRREGFRKIHILNGQAEVDAVEVERTLLYPNKKALTGPFDLIGDVHGCCDELEELLENLGYQRTLRETPGPGGYLYRWHHRAGRKAIFVGDITDRGPRNLHALELVAQMVADNEALCVCGNHDEKFLRALQGKKVKLNHGLEETWAEIEALDQESKRQFKDLAQEFLEGLISHYVLDEGRLVVAHAGLREDYHGRASGKVRSFALYGETTGEKDQFGLPVRLDWALRYTGNALVVYGHTPVAAPRWMNRTVNIDTGCCFGGALTALRYPEEETISVPAREMYKKPGRPIISEATKLTLLDLGRFLETHRIDTELIKRISIQAGQTAAAIEVMSRFAVDPRWLIYLPPTMSPTETSQEPGYLERPEEAFAFYRKQGLSRVICEEKHMGSRAIVVVCRDDKVPSVRFGFSEEYRRLGRIYTRTGRPFFPDQTQEDALLQRLRDTLTATGFWEEFQTSWACIDTELMPWSFKARSLLKNQYAAVGAAATLSLTASQKALARAAQRGLAVQDLTTLIDSRATSIDAYKEAYGHYCWPVDSLDDIRLAPFHLLATEGATFFQNTHLWHMETLARFCQTGIAPSLQETGYRIVDLHDKTSEEAAITWWESMVQDGGEGMVIKPEHFLARNQKSRLVQPALKSRGPQYLRIIYGPEYLEDRNLKRLRKRGLGRKRSLALREFALGLDALQRFVDKEPLFLVHERMLAILALESESIDPRL